MRLKHFNIPIYNQQIWFGVDDSIDTIIKKWTEHAPTPPNDLFKCRCLAGSITDKNGVVNLYIFLPNDYTSGELAHEALHVVVLLFKDINADIEDEPANYLLTYLVDEFEKFVCNEKAKKNKKKN